MNTHKMHSYIWGWAGLMAAFVITLPLAIMRVSGTEKFPVQHVISDNCVGQGAVKKAATTLWQCAQLKVEPLKPKK